MVSSSNKLTLSLILCLENLLPSPNVVSTPRICLISLWWLAKSSSRRNRHLTLILLRIRPGCATIPSRISPSFSSHSVPFPPISWIPPRSTPVWHRCVAMPAISAVAHPGSWLAIIPQKWVWCQTPVAAQILRLTQYSSLSRLLSNVFSFSTLYYLPLAGFRSNTT